MYLQKIEEDFLIQLNYLGYNFAVIGIEKKYKIYKYDLFDIVENELTIKGKDVTLITSQNSFNLNLNIANNNLNEKKDQLELKFSHDLEKLPFYTLKFPMKFFWYINFLHKGSF